MENNEENIKITSRMAERFYTFNHSGNIMLSTTEKDTKEIPKEVNEIFSEVSVFFSAMIKAISQTIDPKSREIYGYEKYYSIYNHEAIAAVINGSNYFVNTAKQQYIYNVDLNDDDFGRKIISDLLGIDVHSHALTFTKNMFSSLTRSLNHFLNNEDVDIVTEVINEVVRDKEGNMSENNTLFAAKASNDILSEEDEKLATSDLLTDLELDPKTEATAFISGIDKKLINSTRKILNENGYAINNSEIKSSIQELSNDRLLKNKSGNIIFVCEYVMGMTFISAIVIYIDFNEMANFTNLLKAKSTNSTVDILFYQDTYTFITPKVIKQFSKDLNSSNTNEDYLFLIDDFKKILERKHSQED